jgi:hypothetical protein
MKRGPKLAGFRKEEQSLQFVAVPRRHVWNKKLLVLQRRSYGLLRSLSFEYFVPFPVSSSANPLSVI